MSTEFTRLSQEETLSAMNFGRSLNVAWASLGPLVEVQRVNLISELYGRFRAGEGGTSLERIVARLVALDDLERSARMHAERGERAAEYLGSEPRGSA